jgi:hypothetical protein
MRPDWVTIILGSKTEPGDRRLGARRRGDRLRLPPGRPASGRDPEVLLPEEVAHFAPIPDPAARFRGMSWLTPVIRRSWATRRDGAQAEVLRERRDAEPVVKLDPAISRRSSSRGRRCSRRSTAAASRTRTRRCTSAAARRDGRRRDLKQLDFKVDAGRRRDADRRGRRRAARDRRPLRGAAGGDVLELFAGAPPVRRRDDAAALAERRRVARDVVNVPAAPSSGTTTATSRSCRTT